MAKRNHHVNPAQEERHQELPSEVKKREARNNARAYMARKGRVKKGDGKEVDHKAFLGGKNGKINNSPSNLRVVSQHTNRIKQPKRK